VCAWEYTWASTLGDRRFLDQILREEVGKYFTLVQIFLCFFNTFCLVEEWVCNKFLYTRVISKVTLSSPCLWVGFHPHPLFQRYSQSKETLLNLSMKCWNSVLHAQGSRVIIVVVQVGAVKKYVTAVEVLRKIERGDEISLAPKLTEKLVWIPVFSFSKISFSVRHLMACYLCRNWLFSPPNRLTL
jgi:hypothetical protein